MNTSIGGARVVAEDYLFEVMEENRKFNEFVGQCISHFVHFVIPRRDQSFEITQDYPVPLEIEDVGGNRIALTRKDNGNMIFVEFWK